MNEVQKKLYAKFQSALKKGDKKNLNNLLFEQVGVLLNTNRDGLIAAIRESGGKVESNVSDRDLAQKISLGIVQIKLTNHVELHTVNILMHNAYPEEIIQKNIIKK